jgi:hypothetical protein
MSQQENNNEMYSSTGSALSFLARSMPSGRAERFLLELANLNEADQASVSRFQERYSDFIPAVPEQGKVRIASKSPQSGLYELESFPRLIFNLQFLLRRAWEQPTPLEREIHLNLTLHEVQKHFLELTKMKPAEGSSYHPVWKAIGNIAVGLTHAQRVTDRMRTCPNSSCPAPHFVAKRKTQKFCSEICAAPAQREQKKAWWNEHGENWRSSRKG